MSLLFCGIVGFFIGKKGENFMSWIINNWSFLVVIVAFIVVGYVYVKKFKNMPTEQQKNMIRAWLLAIVVEAERTFGSKTGKIKLSWAYSQFVGAFPSLAEIISFELFSKLVDEVLEQMRTILENNENAKSYVEGS